MLRLLQQYRTWLAMCGLFVFPLLVYRAHATNDRDANVLDRGLFLLTSPVQEFLIWSTDFIAEGWYTYVDVVGARKENVGLRLRLGELQREVGRTETVEDENHRLRALLKMKQSNFRSRTLSARVIGHLDSAHHRGLRIARGLVDGLERGMAVLEPGGLVGRLQRVGFHSADVVFVVDADVSVDVIAVRARLRGRLYGDGNSEGLRFEPTRKSRIFELAIGDRVVTSGLGGVYPPNIPLGDVAQISQEKGNENGIVVVPSVDFDTLRTVMIILEHSNEKESWITPLEVLPKALAPIERRFKTDVATVTSTR